MKAFPWILATTWLAGCQLAAHVPLGTVTQQAAQAPAADGPARIQVQLALPQRRVQSLPVTWDSGTISIYKDVVTNGTFTPGTHSVTFTNSNVITNDTGTKTVVAPDVPGTQTLAVDGSGNIFVGSATQVTRIDPQGHQSLFATPANGVTALATDAAGNVYVGTAMGLVKYNGQGVAQPFAASAIPASRVSAVALDPQGNMFVAVSPSIKRYHPDGSLDAGFAPAGFPLTQALGTDSAGNLEVYFRSMFGPGVSKFSSKGVRLNVSPAVLANGVAFDPTGNMFALASTGAVTEIDGSLRSVTLPVAVDAQATATAIAIGPGNKLYKLGTDNSATGAVAVYPEDRRYVTNVTFPALPAGTGYTLQAFLNQTFPGGISQLVASGSLVVDLASGTNDLKLPMSYNDPQGVPSGDPVNGTSFSVGPTFVLGSGINDLQPGVDHINVTLQSTAYTPTSVDVGATCALTQLTGGSFSTATWNSVVDAPATATFPASGGVTIPPFRATSLRNRLRTDAGAKIIFDAYDAHNELVDHAALAPVSVMPMP